MKRSGFTLIELIFVMVVIGVLAAVALPKFKELKQNAELTNIISAYTTVTQNASAAFYNETELNGLRPQDLNMTNFLKVQNYADTAGKGWWKNQVSNNDVRYYIDPADYIQFTYNKSVYTPQIRITLRLANGSKKAIMQRKITKKLGLTFVNDTNTTILDIGEE